MKHALPLTFVLCAFLLGGCASTPSTVVSPTDPNATSTAAAATALGDTATVAVEPTPTVTAAATATSTPTATPQPTLPPMQGLGNTSANIRNHGYAVEGDGVIYYTDRQNGGNLWRAAPDGSGAVMVLEEKSSFLNISGGEVYFVGSEGIQAVGLDGTGLRTVKPGWFTGLIVQDEWLYYVDTDVGNICRVRADGTGEEILVTGQYEPFLMDESSLYYLVDSPANSGSMNIWRCGLDGSDPKRVSKANVQANTLLLHDGWLYYTSRDDPFCPYRMKTDGSNRKKLSDFSVNTTAVAGGKLLMQLGKGIVLLKDGDTVTLVKGEERFCYDLNVAGDYLFYATNDEKYRLSRVRLDGTGVEFVGE